MSKFQALVCNKYDLEKLQFTIKLVAVPLHFVFGNELQGTGAISKDSD